LVIEAKPGDTLVRLGRRYGLTVGDLARINRFSYNTDLRDGQKVVVYSPVGARPRELAAGLSPEPRRDRAVIALARGGATRSNDKAVGGPAARVATRDKVVPGGRDKATATAGGKSVVARGAAASGKSAPKTQPRPAGQKPAPKKK